MNRDIVPISMYTEGRGSGFFRANAKSGNTQQDLQKLDAALSRYSGYKRIDRLEPLSDTKLIEQCRAESRKFSSSSSCSKTLELFRKHIPKANPTTETNLVVCIMYWSLRCLPKRGNAGESVKFVYTGKCGYKEYLFCYYASLVGYDVLIVPKEGEPELPKALLELSLITELKDIVVPSAPVRNVTSSAGTVSRNNTPQSGSRIDLVRHTPRRGRQVAVRDDSPAPPRQIRTEMQTQPTRSTSAVNYQAPNRELSFEELAGFARSVVMIVTCDNTGETRSSASGIIISRNGYILTNCHVVREAASFMVRFENDNKVYRTSKIIKYHTNYDLAIIKIERECEPIRMYDGRQELVRGQRVCAIGSPLGLFNSVSDGIISGFRKVDDMQMIQFTAPISGGSSGGALLNLSGEVIGICTAGMSSGQNINLAVSYKQILPFIGGFH